MRTLVAGGLTLRRQRRRQHVVFKGNPFQSLPTQESALKRERPVSGAGSICKRARCRFHISPLPALREPGADRGLPGRRRSLRSFLLWNLRLFRNRDAARAVKKARFFPACAGAHISLPNLAPCGLSWDSSRSRRSSGYFSPPVAPESFSHAQSSPASAGSPCPKTRFSRRCGRALLPRREAPIVSKA